MFQRNGSFLYHGRLNSNKIQSQNQMENCQIKIDLDVRLGLAGLGYAS